MKRKIYKELLQWKQQDNGKTAILIDGARRVGKSYIAQQFAKNEYRTYVLIDFSIVSKDILDLFDNYVADLDTFFMHIATFYNVTLYERDTLFIFDEVQFYPKARTAIKHLVADGRYDYLETGSLMSIKANVKDILLPSEERHLEMFPLDFAEFLWALDQYALSKLIENAFAKKEPLHQSLHRKAMNYFRQYMIVGGMPQVVEAYVQTKDFTQVDRVKRAILDLYRADIVKHANGSAIKVRQIFDDIPAQLSKHDKKFRVSALNKNGRFRDYDDALFWLSDAMIINNCFNSTDPNIGLKLNMERARVKCYMADTGLLVSHAFDERGIVSKEIYKKILFDKLEFNKGMLVENVVAQMLRAAGHKLYFYKNYSRVDSASRMEIDFLIATSCITRRHNVSPIEVKSGKNYTLSSLRKYVTKFSQQVDTPYIVHSGNVERREGFVFLPLYMVPFL